MTERQFVMQCNNKIIRCLLLVIYDYDTADFFVKVNKCHNSFLHYLDVYLTH